MRIPLGVEKTEKSELDRVRISIKASPDVIEIGREGNADVKINTKSFVKNVYSFLSTLVTIKDNDRALASFASEEKSKDNVLSNRDIIHYLYSLMYNKNVNENSDNKYLSMCKEIMFLKVIPNYVLFYKKQPILM